MTKNTLKVIKFDEKDSEMIAEAKLRMPFARTDIDVLRYSLYAYLNPGKSVSPAEITDEDRENLEKNKPRKLSKEGLAYVLDMIERDVLCPVHPTSAMSQCKCTEKTPELVERMVCLGYGV